MNTRNFQKAKRTIEKQKAYPPIQFRKLLDLCAIDHPKICREIEGLLEKKRAGEELKLGPRIRALNIFIEEHIAHYREFAGTADSHKTFEEKVMDTLFRDTLLEVHGDRF